MWTSLYNFLCNKLFYKPDIGFRRSTNASCDGFYGKRLKLIESIWDSNGFANQNKLSSSMQRENVDISDNEEDCLIIAEIPRRKKPGNFIAVQKPSEPSSSPQPPEKHEFWPSFSPHNDRLGENGSNKNNTEVKYINKVSGVDSNDKASTKKFFTTQRASLSHGKLAKSRLSYRNQLKKKVNLLQESYRLTEKFQYMQLLHSQTAFDFGTVKPCLRHAKNLEKQVEVIDLCNEKDENEERPTKEKPEEQDIQILGEFPSVKSFQDILKIRPLNAEIALKEMSSDHYKNNTDILKLPEKSVSLIDVKNADLSQKTHALEEKLRTFMQISDPAAQEVENRELYDLPELTAEQERKIKKALIPEPSREVLSQGFGLQITRQDMQTLVGLNWLNDEIINFYMNLIMERSKSKRKLPKVYVFNTFFYPKLVSDGYTSLKRWTKQVDIFSFDLILVPIHLGMHWCLSVIDFPGKSVRYYDSVGSPNDACLERLLLYLKLESLDKKNKIFPLHSWKKINVEDIPQQMNGGDCGVFSCMFAEHLARKCSILFTQDDMPYFRKKMVIELLEKKLLT